MNTAASQVPSRRKGSAKSGPMRAAISEVRGLLLTTMLKRRKMLARGNELVDQHRRELSVSGAHPRSIPGQNIRRL